jgi:hypothetical protein
MATANRYLAFRFNTHVDLTRFTILNALALISQVDVVSYFVIYQSILNALALISQVLSVQLMQVLVSDYSRSKHQGTRGSSLCLLL